MCQGAGLPAPPQPIQCPGWAELDSKSATAVSGRHASRYTVAAAGQLCSYGWFRGPEDTLGAALDARQCSRGPPSARRGARAGPPYQKWVNKPYIALLSKANEQY